MSRRPLLLLPAVLGALALPSAPALAGEDDGSGSATLRASQGCVTGHRAKATVTGDSIDSVAFSIDGRRVKRATDSDGDGRYVLTMRCSDLSVGAHRGKAVVSFEEGSQTLRFQVTKSSRGTPRFAG